MRKPFRCDKIKRSCCIVYYKRSLYVAKFSPVRLVALDLDGTLLNRKGKSPPHPRRHLQAALWTQGVAMVPATGRPLASLPPVVAQLPGIRYAITSNGAAVWDLGDDPMGAVYSRYSNAAERRTSRARLPAAPPDAGGDCREAFACSRRYHGDLSVFCDGTPSRRPGIALAARRAPAHSTEARQPNDGRFTVCGTREWMTRHAHEIEKLCMFFEPREGRRCPAPLQCHPGRGGGAGLAGQH